MAELSTNAHDIFESRRRLISNWEHIIAKYDREFPDCDIIDLHNGVVIDKGHLSNPQFSGVSIGKAPLKETIRDNRKNGVDQSFVGTLVSGMASGCAAGMTLTRDQLIHSVLESEKSVIADDSDGETIDSESSSGTDDDLIGSTEEEGTDVNRDNTGGTHIYSSPGDMCDQVKVEGHHPYAGVNFGLVDAHYTIRSPSRHHYDESHYNGKSRDVRIEVENLDKIMPSHKIPNEKLRTWHRNGASAQPRRVVVGTTATRGRAGNRLESLVAMEPRKVVAMVPDFAYMNAKQQGNHQADSRPRLYLHEFTPERLQRPYALEENVVSVAMDDRKELQSPNELRQSDWNKQSTGKVGISPRSSKNVNDYMTEQDFVDKYIDIIGESHVPYSSSYKKYGMKNEMEYHDMVHSTRNTKKIICPKSDNGYLIEQDDHELNRAFIEHWNQEPEGKVCVPRLEPSEEGIIASRVSRNVENDYYETPLISPPCRVSSRKKRIYSPRPVERACSKQLNFDESSDILTLSEGSRYRGRLDSEMCSNRDRLGRHAPDQENVYDERRRLKHERNRGANISDRMFVVASPSGDQRLWNNPEFQTSCRPIDNCQESQLCRRSPRITKKKGHSPLSPIMETRRIRSRDSDRRMKHSQVRELFDQRMQVVDNERLVLQYDRRYDNSRTPNRENDPRRYTGSDHDLVDGFGDHRMESGLQMDDRCRSEYRIDGKHVTFRPGSSEPSDEISSVSEELEDGYPRRISASSEPSSGHLECKDSSVSTPRKRVWNDDPSEPVRKLKRNQRSHESFYSSTVSDNDSIVLLRGDSDGVTEFGNLTSNDTGNSDTDSIVASNERDISQSSLNLRQTRSNLKRSYEDRKTKGVIPSSEKIDNDPREEELARMFALAHQQMASQAGMISPRSKVHYWLKQIEMPDSPPRIEPPMETLSQSPSGMLAKLTLRSRNSPLQSTRSPERNPGSRTLTTRSDDHRYSGTASLQSAGFKNSHRIVGSSDSTKMDSFGLMRSPASASRLPYSQAFRYSRPWPVSLEFRPKRQESTNSQKSDDPTPIKTRPPLISVQSARAKLLMCCDETRTPSGLDRVEGNFATPRRALNRVKEGFYSAPPIVTSTPRRSRQHGLVAPVFSPISRKRRVASPENLAPKKLLIDGLDYDSNSTAKKESRVIGKQGLSTVAARIVPKVRVQPLRNMNRNEEQELIQRSPCGGPDVCNKSFCFACLAQNKISGTFP